MATVEKNKRKNADGKIKKSDQWYVQYSFSGKRRRVAAWTNQQASKQLAANIEKLKSCREAGIPPPKDLISAIDRLDERILKHLNNAGLLDSTQTAGAQVLSDHLKTWANQELAPKGNTEKHVGQRVGRARRLLEAADARWWSDLDPARVEGGFETFKGCRRAFRQHGQCLSGRTEAVHQMDVSQRSRSRRPAQKPLAPKSLQTYQVQKAGVD